MLKILAIAQKDLLLRFSTRSELLFFFILPAVFTFALGGGFGGQSSPTGQTITIVNEDNGEVAQNLLRALEANELVIIESVDAEAASVALAEQEIPGYLTIPVGFSQAVLAGEAIDITYRRAVSGETDGQAQKQMIRAAVAEVTQLFQAASQSVAAAEERRPFVSDAERRVYFQEAQLLGQKLLAALPTRYIVTFPPTTQVDANDSQAAVVAHQSAGQLVTWVFIPLLGTAALLAGERSRGTLRRLLTTPTEKSTFILGTIAGQLGAAMVQMALLVGFGSWVLGISWGRSPGGLAIMMVTFGLASVALGTMLGTFVTTEEQSSGLSILLGMSMALLGGCWWPLEFFPETVQTVVKILPTTWAMQGFSDLAIRGLGVTDILPEAGALGLFTVVFFIIGVYRFRYE